MLEATAVGLPALLAVLLRPRFRVTFARAHAAVVRSERLARRLRLPDTCLYRALVRWTALRHAGVPASFVLGLRRDAPDTGHAWVEIAGAPAFESADDTLVETYRFP